MLGASAIQSISDVAAYRAAQEEQEPLIIWDAERDARGIPFLGSYVPQGWSPEGEPIMVDSSGFGEPGERALTQDQFVEHLKAHPTLGWAIIESGQFQVWVQAFAEDPEAEGVEAPEPSPCDECGTIHNDIEECDEDGLSRCVACGDVIDYCQGHGAIGDPAGRAILDAHDADDHENCHIAACGEAT